MHKPEFSVTPFGTVIFSSGVPMKAAFAIAVTVSGMTYSVPVFFRRINYQLCFVAVKQNVILNTEARAVFSHGNCFERIAFTESIIVDCRHTFADCQRGVSVSIRERRSTTVVVVSFFPTENGNRFCFAVVVDFCFCKNIITDLKKLDILVVMLGCLNITVVI